MRVRVRVGVRVRVRVRVLPFTNAGAVEATVAHLKHRHQRHAPLDAPRVLEAAAVELAVVLLREGQGRSKLHPELHPTQHHFYEAVHVARPYGRGVPARCVLVAFPHHVNTQLGRVCGGWGGAFKLEAQNAVAHPHLG